MKIRVNAASGNALIVVLLTTVLIGVTLASYLGLVSNQNISIHRSQIWNAGIPVAEAGIEEAMAHLNRNGTNLTADGWVLEGTNVWKERQLGPNKYRVYISRLMDPPVIKSDSLVLIPDKNESMERVLSVATTNIGVFSKGMVAKGEIDLNGNNVHTDSFDSQNPSFSTGGQYDPAKARDNGDIATNSQLINSVNVGNANINGKVSTGPGGSIAIGPNGSIGPKWWTDHNNGIYQPSWVSDDMNVHFNDVTAPFQGGGFPPLNNQNVGGTNYNHVLGSGNYQMSSLGLSGQNKMLVQGHAVLFVTGNVSLSGQAKILIAPNASLKLYVAGSSASIGGNGVVNASGSALNFSYWGLPSNTSVSMSGNGGFIGTIYAPQAALTLGGGGNDTKDFIGASVSNTVLMNGHFNFHYDEALGRFGPRRGYTIISWNEAKWLDL